jgi:uncharacterized protein
VPPAARHADDRTAGGDGVGRGTSLLLRGSIVFRSAPGTKLDLLVTEPVTFEVDWSDPEGRTGWSVVVQGLAYEASDREIDTEDVSLAPFVDRQNSRWVRLVPQSITGRRIVESSCEAQR